MTTSASRRAFLHRASALSLAGVATPCNERIVDTVWSIAKGRVKSSRETLDQVCAGE